MVILLEGVNGTGKTSLAKQLGKALNFPTIKFVAPVTDAFDYFDLSVVKNTHLIIDRYHLSNWVYGSSEGGTTLSWEEWMKLDTQLQERGVWLFLMVGDPFEIQERLVERDGKAPSTQRLALLQQRFLEAYEMSGIEVKGTFDYSTFLNEERFEHLVGEIRKNL